jgi:hypothetical protein
MSEFVTSIRFGQIGNAPVVLAPDCAYILRQGHLRWSALKTHERGTVTYLQPYSFIRRHARAAERLPSAFKGCIKPIKVDGQLVGFTRTIGTGTYRNGQGNAASASIVSLRARREELERQEATFNLGSHTYSGAPGLSWTCDYRIERLNDDGTLWDILATDEETGEYQSMGSHSLEAAQEYFDSVYFEISRDQWEAMGATFHIEEDEDDYEEFENEADGETVCVD